MKFSDRLKYLGHTTYESYLASEHWQDFKVRYRTAKQPMRCAVCNAGRIQLHHHTYDRLGCEQFSDVTPLCREHHVEVHEWLKANANNIVGRTHKAVQALRGVKPPQVPDDRRTSIAKMVDEIHSVASTKRQRKTCVRLAKRRSEIALRSLLLTVRDYVKKEAAQNDPTQPQKPKRIKPPKKKRERRSYRERPIIANNNTMALIKSIIARKP